MKGIVIMLCYIDRLRTFYDADQMKEMIRRQKSEIEIQQKDLATMEKVLEEKELGINYNCLINEN